APRVILNGGITVRHPFGWRASLRVRHVGDRPATEDGTLTATGYTLLDAYLGFAHRRFELGLILENVVNVSWREAQFADDSRLRPTRSAPRLPIETTPVTDIHFTPGNPINARGALTVYF